MEPDKYKRPAGARKLTTAVRVCGASVYLGAMFLVPAHWGGEGGAYWLPLELLLLLPLLMLLSAVAGSTRTRWPTQVLAAMILVLFMLSVADSLVLRVFDRRLDIPLDAYLVPALLEFARDALGRWTLLAWLAGTLAASIVLYLLTFFALHVLATSLPATSLPARRVGWGAVLVVALATSAEAFSDPGRSGSGCNGHPPFSCSSLQVLARQVDSAIRIWQPLPEFDQALANDELAERQPLLNDLAGADVLLVFVESYGSTAIRNDAYRQTIVPLLDSIETRLRDRGLSVASGLFEAPTVGGLSWLSHGTLLSGVWLDSQQLYQRLIASDRRTLVHVFADAGYRTVGIFPQTLRPWPEGRFFGYEQIWTSENITYEGPRFGWTTMPDQYTLSFLQQRERGAREGRRPLFAEVALISSHAPWEPLPKLVEDWESIGRGNLFRGMVPEDWEGPTGWPREAPANYSRSLEYTLQAVAGFADRFVDRETLLIVLGDHQPAPLITGATEDRTVPVHVIAGRPDLLEPFLRWGFTPSTRPGPGAEARSMDRFRDWFVSAFSETASLPAVSQSSE